MTGIIGCKRKAFLGFCFLPAATACAAPDPANEAPVDLQTGLYAITLGGAGMLKHSEKQGPHEYCLREAERARFPHLLAQNYFYLHGACRQDPAPREGNAISGEITCAADPKMARGANRFIYDGVVARDRAHVEVRMKLEASVKEDEMTKSQATQLKMAMKVMEHARFAIEAVRIGECS